MRIALIDGNKKSLAYPIALLKIGAWLKSLGHKCKLFSNRLPDDNIKYSEVWISTVFTFDIPFVRGMIQEAKKKYKTIKVGGIAASLMPEHFKIEGVEITTGRIPEIEKFTPDYSLLNEKPEYSIAYLSRGCIRKCKFCMVSILEPKFENVNDWEKDLYPGAKHILFYDNNWLAKPLKHFEKDIEDLKRVIEEKNILTIDFNQALDCRLLTKRKADLIKDLPIEPIRFAFDGMHEDGHWQKAMQLMIERGKRNFISLVLYNFKDTPEDFYYRLKEHAIFTYKYKIHCFAFPMKYRPVLRVQSRKKYIGEYWTQKEFSGYHAMIANHSGTGIVACGNRKAFDYNAVKEFEYFYGRDEKEFKKLINYPDIYKLVKRKKMKVILDNAKLNKEC